MVPSSYTRFVLFVCLFFLFIDLNVRSTQQSLFFFIQTSNLHCLIIKFTLKKHFFTTLMFKLRKLLFPKKQSQHSDTLQYKRSVL